MNLLLSRKNAPSAGWRRLGIAIVAIAVVWGIVLPRLERTPMVQARIKRLEDHGIDPAAFFYTDHEGMNQWEAKVRKTQH